MSDVRTAVSPEQVQKTLSLVLSTLKFISTIVPGETDDRVVSILSSLAQETWVVPAITFLVNKFDSSKPITPEEIMLAFKVSKDGV